MLQLIVGALIFAFGLISFIRLHPITLAILAFGLILALYGAAKIAAEMVMQGIKAEADRRDALPARVPVANLSSTSETVSSTPSESVSSAPAPTPIVVSSKDNERLN